MDILMQMSSPRLRLALASFAISTVEQLEGSHTHYHLMNVYLRGVNQAPLLKRMERRGYCRGPPWQQRLESSQQDKQH